MAAVLFITHPEVVIDPKVPFPNGRCRSKGGRARHHPAPARAAHSIPPERDPRAPEAAGCGPIGVLLGCAPMARIESEELPAKLLALVDPLRRLFAELVLFRSAAMLLAALAHRASRLKREVQLQSGEVLDQVNAFWCSVADGCFPILSPPTRTGLPPVGTRQRA